MAQRFPGQKEGETIEYLVSKHWIIYVRILFFSVTLMAVGIGLYMWAVTSDLFSENVERMLGMSLLLYLAVVVLIMFIRWLEDELDVIIITTERVISIDQVTFMHRTVSETELSQIQDVKHISKGVLSHVLKFGDLEIQTAAEKIVFRIKQVSRPHEMARHIMDLCNEYKKRMVSEGEAHAFQEVVSPLPPNSNSSNPGSSPHPSPRSHPSSASSPSSNPPGESSPPSNRPPQNPSPNSPDETIQHSTF